MAARPGVEATNAGENRHGDPSGAASWFLWGMGHSAAGERQLPSGAARKTAVALAERLRHAGFGRDSVDV